MLKQQITQEELRRRLAEYASVSEEAVAKIMEELSRLSVYETRVNGGFLLPGIGMIDRVERFERTGRNPATGAPMKIPAKAKVHFHFASRFKREVDAN